MTQINVDEAAGSLATLVERAQSGEQIVIVDGGRALVELVPVRPKLPRKPGTGKGRIKIHDSFFEPLPEAIQTAFEGGDE